MNYYRSISILSLIVILIVVPSSTEAATRECGKCNNKSQCITKRCIRGRCVYLNTASVLKCFPKGQKKECQGCQFSYDCGKGLNCAKNKCVRGTVQKSVRCFPKGRECARCYSNNQCAQGKCVRNKCTSGIYQSLKRCGLLAKPKPKTPRPNPNLRKDCERCKWPGHCQSGSCFKGICGKPWITRRCPKFNCVACSKNAECRGKRCALGICSNGSLGSRLRCGKLNSCGKCKSHSDCASHFCWKNVCYPDKKSFHVCRK